MKDVLIKRLESRILTTEIKIKIDLSIFDVTLIKL